MQFRHETKDEMKGLKMRKNCKRTLMFAVAMGIFTCERISAAMYFNDEEIRSRTNVLNLDGQEYILDRNTYIYCPIQLSLNTRIATNGYKVYFFNNIVLAHPEENPVQTITKFPNSLGSIIYTGDKILNGNLDDITTNVLPPNDVLVKKVYKFDLNSVPMLVNQLTFQNEVGPETWIIGGSTYTVTNSLNTPTQRVIEAIDRVTITCDYQSYPQVIIEDDSFYNLNSNSLTLNHINWNGTIIDTINKGIGEHQQKTSVAVVTFELQNINSNEITIPTGVDSTVYKTIIEATNLQTVNLNVARIQSDNIKFEVVDGVANFIAQNTSSIESKQLTLSGTGTFRFDASNALVFTQPLVVSKTTR